MKIFKFSYVKNLDQLVKAQMKLAAESSTPNLNEGVLYFDRLEDLMRSASRARLELFECILETRPNSLYELANTIQKDQSFVLREAKALESMGLIRLQTNSTGGREKLKPIALYDKILIDVSFSRKPEAA